MELISSTLALKLGRHITPTLDNPTTAERLALLFRIREITSSNLGLETG